MPTKCSRLAAVFFTAVSALTFSRSNEVLVTTIVFWMHLIQLSKLDYCGTRACFSVNGFIKTKVL